MTQTTSALPQVTPEQRADILAAARTTPEHRRLMASVPAMSLLEVGGTATAPMPPAITVAAWNTERCLYPACAAALLKPHAPDVLLLSEMDIGMSRSGQRHTPAEMARALGMSYAYGVEFHELGLGGKTERHLCKDDVNTHGWHGNAVLSAVPFDALTLIRLDDHGHWFLPGENGQDPGQARIGGRIAVAAIIGGICCVSTHLESNATPPHRDAQFTTLMDAIDRFAPNLPVVIGGDLNTGNRMPPTFDWRLETLFATATARGYDWRANTEGTTTRASLISPNPTRRSKLDWLATRGLTATNATILPCLDPDNRPLSDHDPVLATLTPKG